MVMYLCLIKPVTALTNEVVMLVKELAFGGFRSTWRPWFGSGLATGVPVLQGLEIGLVNRYRKV